MTKRPCPIARAAVTNEAEGREEDVLGGLLEHRQDADREQQAREGEEGVGDPREEPVHPAEEEARQGAHEHADADRDGGADHAHAQGDPRAVDQPAQDVPAELVGPEQVAVEAGRRPEGVPVLLEGVVGSEDGGHDADGDHHGDEHQPGHGGPVPAQAPEREPERRGVELGAPGHQSAPEESRTRGSKRP